MNIEIKNIDEMDKVNEIKFTIVGDKQYLEDYLFNNDVYTYAIDENTKIKYALPKFTQIQKYQTNKLSVKINGKEYYKEVTFIKNKEEEFALYGKSTKIYLDRNKINFNIKGNIYERIHDIEFIVNLLKYREIMINDEKLPMHINIKEHAKQEYIECLNEDLRRYNKIKNLFEKFNVKFVRDIDTLDEKSIKNLNRFLRINDGKLLEGMQESNTYYIEIAEYCIAFIVSIDASKKVNVYNYFSDLSDKMKVFYYDKDKKEIPISPYINLTFQNLLTFTNIDIEEIKKTFESPYYSEETCERYNLWLLDVRKAYDKSKDDKWLEFAKFLNEKILKFNNSPIYIINKMQIIKRSRNLDSSEKEILYEIKEKEKDNMMQCAIAILLENKSDFERYFAKLGEEDKNNFIEFPIYCLIK